MDLPESLDWPERTREWWAAWVESPITSDWTPLQWEFLLDTALLHATVWGVGDVTKAGELRTRVDRLGGLPAVSKAVPAAPVVVSEAAKKVTPLDELEQRRAARSAGA